MSSVELEEYASVSDSEILLPPQRMQENVLGNSRVYFDDNSVFEMSGGTHFDGSKKCLNCGEFFESNGESACRYHSGTFGGRNMMGVMDCSWSCCKERDREHESGCTVGFHVEDEVMTALMETFVVVDGYSNEVQISETESVKNVKEEDVVEDSFEESDVFVKINGELYLKYRLSESDSLIGICLRYKIKKEKLKRLNKIYTDNQIKALSYLLLPYNPELMGGLEEELVESSPESKIFQFMHQTKVNYDEAKVYLECNDYDLQLSLKEWEEDMNFEAKEGYKK